MDNVPDDAMDEALLVECPHILYPFACNILADLTRDANFPPIQLQAVDFVQVWQDKRMRQAAGAG
jgi:preprotein translocase subunit SecB